ncbi:hypothetical protein L484_026548 [Morus notabilis]|uniref:Uncharacterized protein n=1 Tax=Morus notabilis TaxID=981085 RepID=W9QZ51_9ROSA|nr:hypothetical protein L484_026548 [Morus notabilis]
MELVYALLRRGARQRSPKRYSRIELRFAEADNKEPKGDIGVGVSHRSRLTNLHF